MAPNKHRQACSVSPSQTPRMKCSSSLDYQHDPCTSCSCNSAVLCLHAHLGMIITVWRCCLDRLQVREPLLFACSPALLSADTYAHRLLYRATPCDSRE